MSTAYTIAQPRVLSGDDARLDFLVNVEGVDQVEAARRLWAPHLSVTSTPVAEPSPWAPLDVQLAWARARAGEIVRAGLADVLAWLRGGVR